MDPVTSCPCKEFVVNYDVDNKLTLDNCYINSDNDILIILYKILVENSLELVFQRLSSSQCQKYVKSGNLFAIIEKSSTFMEGSNENGVCKKNEVNSSKKHLSNLELEDGITRWTDKLVWTSSRMLNKKFLVYKQKNAKSEKERLIKKTFSMKIDGKSIRIISYYNEHDIREGNIKSVSELYEDFDKHISNKDALEVFGKKIKEINISGYTNSNRSFSQSIEGRVMINDFEKKNHPKEELKKKLSSPVNSGYAVEITTIPPPNFSYVSSQPGKVIPGSNVFIQNPQQALSFPAAVAHQYYLVPQMSFLSQASSQPIMTPNYTVAINSKPLFQYPYQSNSQINYTHQTNTSMKSKESILAGKDKQLLNLAPCNHSEVPVPSRLSNFASNSMVKGSKNSPKLPSIKDLQLPRL